MRERRKERKEGGRMCERERERKKEKYTRERWKEIERERLKENRHIYSKREAET